MLRLATCSPGSAWPSPPASANRHADEIPGRPGGTGSGPRAGAPLPGAGPAGPPSDPASALLVAVTAVPFFACSYESCIIIIVVIVVVVMVTSTS